MLCPGCFTRRLPGHVSTVTCSDTKLGIGPDIQINDGHSSSIPHTLELSMASAKVTCCVTLMLSVSPKAYCQIVQKLKCGDGHQFNF